MNHIATGALPLDEQQDNRLQDAVRGLTPAQLHFVSGYAAGFAAAASDAQPVPLVPSATSIQQLTVLFGSQTGNGEQIGRQLVSTATDRGFAARAVSLADFKPASLRRETVVAFVVSTHGEGDPPDDAELFHEFLLSDKAGSLAGLRYSLLALGDSSYVNFCQTGQEIDQRLEQLGAERFESLVECDLDYDAAAKAWSVRVVDQLQDLLDRESVTGTPQLRAVADATGQDRNNPFRATVLLNQKITGADSSKDVRHVELSIENSDIRYEPGDSLAVVTHNPPQLVDEFLGVMALNGDTIVTIDSEEMCLREALSDKLEITVLSLVFLRAWAKHSQSDALQSVLGASAPDTLANFIAAHQVIDVVRGYPADTDGQSFVQMLRKLNPRSYSIASSLAVNPDEVHLTVAAVRYDAFGRHHWGAASTMLADRLAAGDSASVFVESNSRFRLPASDVPIVMIGAGTGVAPFRAFVEERTEQGASGDNWLFYGDRNRSSDFLYQLEWQRYLKTGALDRLDVAFSRDQQEKIYVQDSLRAKGAELYRWIQRGAVVYVCGDAKHMAGDVEDALVDILTEHGDGDRESGVRQLKELKRSRRYQRDVY